MWICVFFFRPTHNTKTNQIAQYWSYLKCAKVNKFVFNCFVACVIKTFFWFRICFTKRWFAFCWRQSVGSFSATICPHSNDWHKCPLVDSEYHPIPLIDDIYCVWVNFIISMFFLLFITWKKVGEREKKKATLMIMIVIEIARFSLPCCEYSIDPNISWRNCSLQNDFICYRSLCCAL